MNEIKCPHCSTVFTINETEYNQLLDQIRNDEFEKEIHSRVDLELKNHKTEFESNLRLKESEFQNKLDNELLIKDNEISRLNVLLNATESDFETKMSNALLEQKLAFEETLNKSASEIQELKNDKTEFESTLLLQESEFKNILDKELANKDSEISRLNLMLSSAESDSENKMNEALLQQRLDFEEKLNQSASEIQELKTEKMMLEQNLKDKYTKQISNLEHQLDSFELMKNAEINSLAKSHETEVKLLQETIETYKDFKARQSTKAIGESLEHFAETEFNKVRSIAFPNAYFAKDNEISKSGSKGDFIFRDYMDGMEFVSVMFEMKNEADTTKSKHRNSDFYKELDKDRREKGCEYAVLVSMLEADNDYFNTGIVDVSAESGYDKMYVIRPQFFIQLIGILRNAALNTIEYKKQIQEIQNQNIDVSNFERDLDEFKNLFFKHYTNATDRFGDAIKAIDASIAQMEKIRDALTKSSTHLKRANDRLEDVSVKKLTRNNPTMQAKFAELD